MTVEKRNFWIIITMIAVLLSAANFIKRYRGHQRSSYHIHMDQKKDRTCKSWKQKKYSCEYSAEMRADNERRELIERKRKKCGSISHVKADEFFLPDQLPTLLNYESVLRDLELEDIRKDGTFAARVQVNKQGEYVSHIVLRSDQPVLTEIVERHIHKLSFEPAVHKGEQVTAWVNVPFRFRSSD